MKPNYSYQDLMVDIAMALEKGETFPRVPEPRGVTDAAESVEQYNQVLETNITVNYSLTLDLIFRTRPEPLRLANSNAETRVIDLCPGPGHLSLCIAEFLNYTNLVGVDFSEPMVKVANKNALQSPAKLSAKFVQGDAKALRFPERHFDLLTFTNAAHHFDSIREVNGILQQADRIVKSDGLIVLTDLARFPAPELTESFAQLAGKDYLDRGMSAMYQDFRASLFAAFTPQELKGAVPKKTERVWFHLVSAGLPFFQALVGLPVGRTELFQRESRDWSRSGLLRSEAARAEWQILRGALYAGELRRVA
jgi:ubiquinone/menaquinone biosynthesis C-methylase UbiE